MEGVGLWVGVPDLALDLHQQEGGLGVCHGEGVVFVPWKSGRQDGQRG